MLQGITKKDIHTLEIDVTLIEDCAQWIFKENPDILILDGPPTYLFGYMVNRFSLQILFLLNKVNKKRVNYENIE